MILVRTGQGYQLTFQNKKIKNQNLELEWMLQPDGLVFRLKYQINI